MVGLAAGRRAAAVVGTLEQVGGFGIGIEFVFDPFMSRHSRRPAGNRRVICLEDGHGLIIILRVLDHRQADLPTVGNARCPAGIFADILEDGEQNGGENRDDGDDDKQLDQRERTDSSRVNSRMTHV